LSTIYEAGWKKLTVNKDNKLFKQFVLAQFNKSLPKSSKTVNQSPLKKEKKTNISRIPPLIPPRPSQSVLAKLKFFKKKQTLTKNS